MANGALNHCSKVLHDVALEMYDDIHNETIFEVYNKSISRHATPEVYYDFPKSSCEHRSGNKWERNHYSRKERC